MKKLLAILSLMLLTAAGVYAQNPEKEKILYKGQVHVSRMELSQADGRVHLNMRVTYSTDLLNRGETLYITPRLTDGMSHAMFPGLVFNGQSKKWRVRGSDVIVVADDAKGNFYFDIELITRYADWMPGSSLCFASEEVINSQLTNHYLDCPFDNVSIGQYGVQPQPEVRKAVAPVVTKAPKVKNKKVKTPKVKTPHDPADFYLRTNLLYDAALLPNVGVEFPLSPKYSLAVNAGGNWIKNDHKHWYWRMLTADVEGRYWLGDRKYDRKLRHQGHHVGVYGAVYRYDIEFGKKGQMGDFAYGGGLSYGYSLPIGKRLNLDLSLGVGYIGGKYKEYEPIDTHYVWIATKQRHYVGPTKAEVALVWKLR